MVNEINKKIVLITILIVLLIGIVSSATLLLPSIIGVEIKQSNLKIYANIEGTERNYPKDIRTQIRYDEYGRRIANDWDRLEEYIEKDRIEILENKTIEIIEVKKIEK